VVFADTSDPKSAGHPVMQRLHRIVAVLPVDLKIPGNPPEPIEILRGSSR